MGDAIFGIPIFDKAEKDKEVTMNSVGADCTELKHKYDECFNRWFVDQFLKGNLKEDEECKTLFSSYQSCVKKALKDQDINISEVERDVLGTPDENKEPPPK